MNNTLSILLLTVLCALVLACIVGIAVGKYQAKKAAGQVRGLLSRRERTIYATSVVLGVALLLMGIFYQGPAPRSNEWDFTEDTHFEDGFSAEAPVVVMPPARQARGGVVIVG